MAEAIKTRAVIVDDEPLSAEVIRTYCTSVDHIELVGVFHNPMEALQFLNAHSVDVLFLDMSMPTLNGAELLQLLRRKPEVIITTAYPEFALEAFNLDATDYLVKPVGFARFLRAVGKATRIRSENHYLPAPDAMKASFIFVKASEGGVRIEIQDITFIRGMGDYLKIFLVSGKPILVLSNFKNMLEKLPPFYFMRVHNSYVVNIAHIVGVQRNRILISEERIPLGESYRKAFFDRINL